MSGKRQIYKSAGVNGFYNFLDSGKSCPGQRPTDKKKFDINLYEIVDRDLRIQQTKENLAAGKFSKKTITEDTLETCYILSKPDIVNIFKTNNFTIDDSIVKFYMKLNKTPEELAAIAQVWRSKYPEADYAQILGTKLMILKDNEETQAKREKRLASLKKNKVTQKLESLAL